MDDDEAQPTRPLRGGLGIAVTALCCALSLFAVKQVFWPSSDGTQHYLSLEAASPAAKEISIETATQTEPVPLNPGAERALAALRG